MEPVAFGAAHGKRCFMSGINGGLPAAASALGRIDLGEDKKDLLSKRVAEMSGETKAKALASVVRALDENLGTILDLKA